MTLSNYTICNSTIPSKLNIRAETRRNNTNVESVYLELDGVSRCEQFKPFAVFGDKSVNDTSNDMANYFGRTISVGRHVVLGIPYTGAKCSGYAGRRKRLVFYVSDCE